MADPLSSPSALSEVVLDDTAWSNAQFSSPTAPTVADIPTPQPSVQQPTEEEPKPLKTGKVVSVVYPSNQHCSWITPPTYDYEKMPKSLSSKQLSVPNSAYREFMRTVTSDVRFQSYCILFSRVVPLWIMSSVIMLMLMLLASQDGGLHVMVFTVLWTVMLCIGLGFCILIRKYLVHGLHLVVRDANILSLKHNVLIGVQDRGQLSCHKIVLILMYYDVNECVSDTKRLIRIHKANQPIKSEMPSEEELDSEAREMLISHTQPYVKAYAKKQLLFPTRPSEGVSEFRPKHCSSSICLCQYVEKKVFHNLPLISG